MLINLIWTSFNLFLPRNYSQNSTVHWLIKIIYDKHYGTCDVFGIN